MKKVSTVAARASKKISQQKLTVGLDLGDRNSWYCVLDESGQIQLEQRVRTNAKATTAKAPAARPVLRNSRREQRGIGPPFAGVVVVGTLKGIVVAKSFSCSHWHTR
jgi:hypothetical protein